MVLYTCITIGVRLDIMHLAPGHIMNGIPTVPPVPINLQTLIIPVIQHHQPCTQWKAIAHGYVMQGII